MVIQTKNIMALKRKTYSDISSIGDLFMPDMTFLCNTIEDTIRNRDKNLNGFLEKSEKVYGETAIPAGRYEIRLLNSPKFNRPMPYLISDWVTKEGLELEGQEYLFKNVMIHWANWAKDIQGCIGVGRNPTLDMVSYSKETFGMVMQKITPLFKQGRLWLDIIGGYTAENMKEKIYGE
jgi:hypothetical protein